MANYANIKATIDANIKANGNEEITGPILNSVLTHMVDEIPAGFVNSYLAGNGSSLVVSPFKIPYSYAAGKTYRISIMNDVDMTGISDASLTRFGVLGVTNGLNNYDQLATIRVTQDLPSHLFFKVPTGKTYLEIWIVGRAAAGETLNFIVEEITHEGLFSDGNTVAEGETFETITLGNYFLANIIMSGQTYAPAPSYASVGLKYTDLRLITVRDNSSSYFRVAHIPIPPGTKYLKYGLGPSGSRATSVILIDKDDYIINYDIRTSSSQNFRRTLSVPPNAVGIIWCENLLYHTVKDAYMMEFHSTGLPEIAAKARINSDYSSAQLGREGSFSWGGIYSVGGRIVDFYPENSTTVNDIRIKAYIPVILGTRSLRVYVTGLPEDASLSVVFGYLGGVAVPGAVTGAALKSGIFTCTIISDVDVVGIVFGRENNAVFSAADVAAVRWKMDTHYSSFLGKRYCALGDSITYGYIPRNYTGYPGQLDSYAKITAQKLGMKFDNYGVSGNTLAYHGDNTAMCVRYAEMPDDADVISVMGGTNDVRNGIPLGQFSDRVNTTFYGALHTLYQGLYTKYIGGVTPTTGMKKKIVVMTPIKLLDASKSSLPNTVANNATVLYEWDAWIAAVKEVAAFYSFPCLDFYNLSGINPHLDRTLVGTTSGYTGNYNPYITDGTHPTQEGAEIMADVFVKFLKNLV